MDSSHRRLLQDPSTTQVYDRPSHPRRVEAVRAIAATYQFDLTGGRLRARNYADDLADRIRAGVGSVPVPAGRCHEMNNVRADGHRCPVYNRCFSCAFCTTDFTHLPELRQLRRRRRSPRSTRRPGTRKSRPRSPPTSNSPRDHPRPGRPCLRGKARHLGKEVSEPHDQHDLPAQGHHRIRRPSPPLGRRTIARLDDERPPARARLRAAHPALGVPYHLGRHHLDDPSHRPQRTPHRQLDEAALTQPDTMTAVNPQPHPCPRLGSDQAASDVRAAVGLVSALSGSDRCGAGWFCRPRSVHSQQ
ncbi:hypothetical protein QFZ64_000435 [Streptomyces sp. B3I8]|nr:hypothetical protein [Streptomyces sp. B3I8]